MNRFVSGIQRLVRGARNDLNLYQTLELRSTNSHQNHLCPLKGCWATRFIPSQWVFTHGFLYAAHERKPSASLRLICNTRSLSSGALASTSPSRMICMDCPVAPRWPLVLEVHRTWFLVLVWVKLGFVSTFRTNPQICGAKRCSGLFCTGNEGNHPKVPMQTHMAKGYYNWGCFLEMSRSTIC